MENFLFLAFLLATGKLLYHRGFPADFGRSLNLFVINISLPAMVLYEVPKLSLDSSLTLYIIMPWSILVFSVMLLWVLFRFINVDKGIRAALYLLIPVGNTSFVGIPMVEAFYGQSHIPQALIYDQFGTFIIFATYGTVLVSLFSGEQINLINVAKKIVIFPSFIDLFIALLLPVPQIFEPMLKTLSMTLVPLAIISVGFSLRLKMEKHKMIFAIVLVINFLDMI
jgi:predicted permease